MDFFKKIKTSTNSGTTNEIENDFASNLSIETSDFKSATIVGLQACLDQPNCSAVVINYRKKTEKVKNRKDKDQNTFFIQDISWKDSIEVWIKLGSGGKEKKLIKTLRMPFLKICDVGVTSATIKCPLDDTFFLRYGEKDGSPGSVETILGGSKKICDLRMGVTYRMELGVQEKTGGPGIQEWNWKDFTTECPTLEPTTIKALHAGLRLNITTIPPSLHYAVNNLDPSNLKRVEGRDIMIGNLAPGMKQVVQLIAKESRGDVTELRLLREVSFTTLGAVKQM